jgi:hypothetical protein
MPRLPSRVLNCVVYLYSDLEAATRGAPTGGTGFLVALSVGDGSDRSFVYAVTNWHVAVRDGHSVVRLNTKDGATQQFDFGPEDWEFDPRYDIAVVPIAIDRALHDFAAIPGPSGFVLAENVEEARLGPGEDVFMVGRFVTHDGGVVNRPAVRFGNISVMASPIRQRNGQTVESYCIDLHGRWGFSGSPVFVFRTPGFDLEERGSSELAHSQVLLAGVNYLALLGIHWGQFSAPTGDEASGEMGSARTPTSDTALGNSAEYPQLAGMTCVLPASSILEILNLPRLIAQREASLARGS